MKTIKCKLYGETYEFYFVKSIYQINFNDYVGVYTVDGEPWSSLTVNLGVMLDVNEAYIDTNNCAKEIIRELEKRGLIIKTDETRVSGFCTYPLYILTDKFLEEWCIEMM